MSQSSPEGIILGKGSQLISHKLTFSDEEPKPYASNPLLLDEIGQFKSGTDKEMPWLPKEDWDKHHQLKQETLEEYIKRETKSIVEPSLRAAAIAFLRYGAKWQQERSYSEEDMRDMYDYGYNNYLPIDKAFEQFKKK